ncbi:S8 family serine peptidase [Armatimonas sp.]|uniref:S8 family serine peptidase n=1 Tax=Armatimonas sp. TaxID=1872638 RepID=UPI00286AB69C|nr:S8 family serine peptidase [Armatimonas sp.]
MRKITLQAILGGILASTSFFNAVDTYAADPPKPLARAGEVILQVSPSMALSDVNLLASSARCELIKPLAYSPGVYLLGLIGRNPNAQPQLATAALESAIRTLKASPLVQVAEPDYMCYYFGLPKKQAPAQRKTRAVAPPGPMITPNDPQYRNQWHMDMIRMPEAWNIQFSQDPRVSTLVAVIDSGIERGHPDFIDPTVGSLVIEHQAFGGGTAGVDTVGHGTHVGGTIGAATNNGNRVASVAGWVRNGLNVRLVDVNIDNGSGGVSSSGVIQGINFAATRGCKVANLSLGGYGVSTAQRNAVRDAIAAGVTIVAAAGNGTVNHATLPGYPSDYPGVIKVTSVGRDRRLSGYSDFGFTENSQIIAAPGGSNNDIISTWPLNGNPIFGPGTNGINSINGTSMASPHVAGVVALLAAAGVPSNQMYNALAAGAQAPGEPLDPNRHGPGILDAYSALLPFSDASPSVDLDSAGITSGFNSGVSTSGDRGVSYFNATPITISLQGVGRIYSNAPPSGIIGLWSLEQDVTVEIQTIGRTPSIVKTFVGGRGVAGQSGRFEIPVLPANAQKSTKFSGITVPALNADGTYTPLSLSPGQYRIVAKISQRNATGIASTLETAQFLTIVEKRLSAGRSMFSVPFKAGTFIRPVTDPNLTPEAALLGKTTVFSLARYNPLRLPSEDDYARFRNTVDSYNLRSASRFDIQDQLNSRIISYDTTLLSSSIAPIGFGYWLDLDRATTVSTTLLPYPTQIPGVSPIAENAVGINMYATGGGWNMIGAPFSYPVDWSVVTVVVEGASYSMADAVKAGYLSPALIGYANGDYVYAIAPSGQLEPFNGYWVRVFRDCTLLIPPVPSASSRLQVAGSNSDGWKARLIANVAGDVDGQNYFGQLRSATDAEDKNDILKPPAGAGHAYVRFNNASSDGKSRALAFDMRALVGNTITHQEWTADVATDRPNANVVLSWDGIRSAPRNSRLTLRDTVTGERIVMGSRSSYTYRSGEAGSSRKFVISIDPQTSGGSLAIRNMRTVQTGGRAASGWSIRFNTNVDAEIQGAVETLDGRPVGDLIGTGRSQSGADTTLRWDGRNKNGGLVAAGPYVVRVKARTVDGQTQVEQRVIQIVR